MTATATPTLGLVVLLLGIGAAGALVAMTYRFSRGRSLVAAMAQTAFLPEKRHLHLMVLSIQGSLLLLVAILWGLVVAGWVPTSIGDTALAGMMVGTVGTVVALTWLGFAPARLTAEERRSLAAQAPAMFQSLVMAPLQVDSSSGPTFRVRVRTASDASGRSPPKPI